MRKHLKLTVAGILILITTVIVIISVQKPALHNNKPRELSGQKIFTAKTEKITDYYTISGTVRAKDEARMAAQVAGTVMAVYAVPGDVVKAGQILARLDGKMADTQARASEHAAVQAGQAANVAAEQLKMARITLDRYSDLLAQKVVSQQDYDRIKNEYEVANETYKLSQAAARSAQANAEAAGTAARYFDVLAPLDGVVAQKQVDAGDMVMPGQALFAIDGSGAKEVEFFLPENMFPLVHRNDAIVVKDYLTTVEGRVKEIAPHISDSTRTFKVRASLPGCFTTPAGQYVQIAVKNGNNRSALLIPESALVQRGQLAGAYVIDSGNIALFRILRIGDLPVNGQIEVLSGLAAGERVAVYSDALQDGIKVLP